MKYPVAAYRGGSSQTNPLPIPGGGSQIPPGNYGPRTDYPTPPNPANDNLPAPSGGGTRLPPWLPLARRLARFNPYLTAFNLGYDIVEWYLTRGQQVGRAAGFDLTGWTKTVDCGKPAIVQVGEAISSVHCTVGLYTYAKANIGKVERGATKDFISFYDGATSYTGTHNRNNPAQGWERLRTPVGAPSFPAPEFLPEIPDSPPMWLPLPQIIERPLSPPPPAAPRSRPRSRPSSRPNKWPQPVSIPPTMPWVIPGLDPISIPPNFPPFLKPQPLPYPLIPHIRPNPHRPPKERPERGPYPDPLNPNDPYTRPSTRPNDQPAFEPVGQPQEEPENNPFPFPIAQLLPGRLPIVGTTYTYKPNGRQTRVRPHARQVPKKRVKEKKTQAMPGWSGPIRWAFHEATEIGDIVDCLLESMPDVIQKRYKREYGRYLEKSKTPTVYDPTRFLGNFSSGLIGKMNFVYYWSEYIDIDKFIECSVLNAIEDRVIGTMNQNAQQGVLKRPGGLPSGAWGPAF